MAEGSINLTSYKSVQLTRGYGSATQPVYFDTTGEPQPIEYIANRLYYTAETNSMASTKHFADTSHIGINYSTSTTSEESTPPYNLYVNGDSYFYDNMTVRDGASIIFSGAPLLTTVNAHQYLQWTKGANTAASNSETGLSWCGMGLYKNGNDEDALWLNISHDNGINFSADGNNVDIRLRFNESVVPNTGNITGNVGTAVKSVYINKGVITPINYELKANVDESEAANRLAYYSGIHDITYGDIETDGGYFAEVRHISITTPTQEEMSDNILYALSVQGDSIFSGTNYFAHNTSYYIDYQADATLRDIKARQFGVNIGADTAGQGYGITLYGDLPTNLSGTDRYAPEYGIMVANTSAFPSANVKHAAGHGHVVGNPVANYFTTSSLSDGWIFRYSAIDIASLDVTGKLFLGQEGVLGQEPGVYWSERNDSISGIYQDDFFNHNKHGIALTIKAYHSPSSDVSDVINLKAEDYIYLNDKSVFTINDDWLRINEDIVNGFSEGIYTGNSRIRSNVELSVGDTSNSEKSNKFYVNNSGNGYISNSWEIYGYSAATTPVTPVTISEEEEEEGEEEEEETGTTTTPTQPTFGPLFTRLYVGNTSTDRLFTVDTHGNSYIKSKLGINTDPDNDVFTLSINGNIKTTGAPALYSAVTEGNSAIALDNGSNNWSMTTNSAVADGALCFYHSGGSFVPTNAANATMSLDLLDNLNILKGGAYIVFNNDTSSRGIKWTDSSGDDSASITYGGTGTTINFYLDLFKTTQVQIKNGSTFVTLYDASGDSHLNNLYPIGTKDIGHSNSRWSTGYFITVNSTNSTIPTMNANTMIPITVTNSTIGDSSNYWHHAYITDFHNTTAEIGTANITTATITTINGTSIIPSTGNRGNIGLTNTRWSEAYINTIYSNDTISGATITATTMSTTNFSSTYIGTSTSIVTNIYSSNIYSNKLLPLSSGTDKTIGNNSSKWTTGYIETINSTTGNITTINANSVIPNTANNSDNAIGSSSKRWYGYFGVLDGTSVYGAVWNDYAECRTAVTDEPGYCVTETSSGIMMKSSQRLQAGCKLISDTYGVLIGETENAKAPIAVSGRVLAYPYRAREEYELGAAVCSAPNGTVDIMTREEIMMYPERIVGTVSEIPTYEVWNSGDRLNPKPIKVDGRIWIYVK